MTGRGSARAAGTWQELGARTAGDSAAARHEDMVDAMLARYYRAAGQAERVRVAARRRAARVMATARRRADAITSGAEREASGAVAEARTAMRELLGLVGGRAEVAELCGLTPKAVSDMLAAAEDGEAPGDAAGEEERPEIEEETGGNDE